MPSWTSGSSTKTRACGLTLTPYGICTYINALPIAALTRVGHRCEMFGKDEKSFKGQPWDTEYQAMSGHDWLVVDDRWVVDLWIKPYINVPRAVFDLKNPADQEQVEYIYGPRGEWEPAPAEHVTARQLHPELFVHVLNT